MLGYYLYVYLMRSSVVSSIRMRSLFLFNCFAFENRAKKTLFRLRKNAIRYKMYTVFRPKYTTGKFSRKLFGRLRDVRKIYLVRKRLFFNKRLNYNNGITKYFLNSNRKYRQHFNNAQVCGEPSKLASMLSTKINNKTSTRLLIRYLIRRILFFTHLNFLYVVARRLFVTIVPLFRRKSINQNVRISVSDLAVFKQQMSDAEKSLIKLSIVQNIAVNSEFGKRKLSYLRDLWYSFARSILSVHRQKRRLFRHSFVCIRYLKISERLSEFMLFLTDFLIAIKGCFDCCVKLIPVIKVKQSKVYFKHLRADTLRCIPGIFEGYDSIFNDLFNKFKQGGLRNGGYNKKLFKLQADVVLFIRTVLAAIREEKNIRRKFTVDSMVPDQVMSKVSYFNCTRLAQYYLKYSMYRFFSALFVFSCSYHFSADRRYIYMGDEILKYNDLLSNSNIVFTKCNMPILIRANCGSFLHNSTLDYYLIIKTSRSNCLAVLLVNGKVIYSSSCGKIGFNKTHRSTYFAANQLGLFMCLFLTKIYGVYLRSTSSRSRNLNSRLSSRSFIGKKLPMVKRYTSKLSSGKSRKFSRLPSKIFSTYRNMNSSKYVSSGNDSSVWKNPIRKKLVYHTYKRLFRMKFNKKYLFNRWKRLVSISNAFGKRYSRYASFLNRAYLLWLLRHGTAKFRKYSKSVASIRLNIQITGSGVGRLAVRRPIYRFTRMIRRFFMYRSSRRSVRRSRDKLNSDSRRAALLRAYGVRFLTLPKPKFTDAQLVHYTDMLFNTRVGSYESAGLDDILAVRDLIVGNRTMVSRNKLAQFDTLLDEILKYWTFNPHAYYRLGRSCGFHRSRAVHAIRNSTFLEILKKASRVPRSINSINTNKNMTKTHVHMLRIKKFFHNSEKIRACFSILCNQYLLLHRRFQMNWIRKLYGIYPYCISNHTVESVLFLYLFNLCSNCVIHYNSHSMHTINKMCFLLYRYIFFFHMLNIFFYMLAKSTVYRQSFMYSNCSLQFYTVLTYLYFFISYFFVRTVYAAITAVARYQAYCFKFKLMLDNLAILLDKMTFDCLAIDSFIYDMFAMFLNIFFAKIYKLFNAIVWYKHILQNKVYSFSKKHIYTPIKSGDRFKMFSNRLITHRYSNLFIVYNHKTISVPHNGCRTRKLRRK